MLLSGFSGQFQIKTKGENDGRHQDRRGVHTCIRRTPGRVFARFAAEEDPREIYAPDGSHPNADGSYLAALCHYAVAYGEDPREVKYNHGTDEITAKILKEAAFEASK